MNVDRAPSRVLVTGGTQWTDRSMIENLLATFADRIAKTGGSFWVITGMADGADEIARSWAIANGINLLADRLESGAYPGPMHRYNKQMLAWEPDLVLAFKNRFDDKWQDEACIAGTEHMCRIAAEAGIPLLLNGGDWEGQE